MFSVCQGKQSELNGCGKYQIPNFQLTKFSINKTKIYFSLTELKKPQQCVMCTASLLPATAGMSHMSSIPHSFNSSSFGKCSCLQATSTSRCRSGKKGLFTQSRPFRLEGLIGKSSDKKNKLLMFLKSLSHQILILGYFCTSKAHRWSPFVSLKRLTKFQVSIPSVM